MRSLFVLSLLAALAAAQTTPPAATERGPGDRPTATRPLPTTRIPALVSNAETRVYPLMNVDLIDARGFKTKLVAFHRISGENIFRGYLGAADIDVPYERVSELSISTPNVPGGRMRAKFTLNSGKEIKATFDEREGEQLFAGYAVFGRVTVYWRDIRKLAFTARTKTSDLPTYGKATTGVDVRMTDRDGEVTELVAFRRVTGENFIEGLRGSSRVEVPLRIVKRAKFRRGAERSPLLVGTLELRDQKPIVLRFPRYAEDPIYRGRAEFGDLRIRLGEVRELIVHRSTPKLRDLDPVAAAEGKEVEIGDPKRR